MQNKDKFTTFRYGNVWFVCRMSNFFDEGITSSKSVVTSSTDDIKEKSNILSELPNKWKMDDFIIAGFDKDGSGDFGYKVFLSQDEINSLPKLLDLSKWQKLINPPEYGLAVYLSLSDTDMKRSVCS